MGRTRKHIGRFAVLCTLLCIFLGTTSVLFAELRLPELADTADDPHIAKLRTELTPAFASLFFEKSNIIPVPEIEYFLTTLGQRLTAATGRTPVNTIRFFLLDDDAVNAFAGPGGIIGINSGLLFAVPTIDAFAAVLAHEIAHIEQAHVERRVLRHTKAQPLVLAGVIAAVLLGSHDAAGGMAATRAVVGGSVESHLAFSREFEQQADRIGMRILAHAGFSPDAMADFLRILLQKEMQRDGSAPLYLRTHPMNSTRIQDSSARAAQLTFTPKPTGDTFAVLQAYAAIASNDTSAAAHLGERARLLSTALHALDTLRHATTDDVRTDAQNRARTALNELQANRFDERITALLHAQLATENGDTASAIQRLHKIRAIYPNFHPVYIAIARTEITAARQHDAHDATQRIATILTDLYGILRRIPVLSGFTYMQENARRYNLPALHAVATAELALLRGKPTEAMHAFNTALTHITNETFAEIITARQEHVHTQ